MPGVETKIVCETAPFDQRLPDVAEELRVTSLSAQKVVDEEAVIVGVAGTGLTEIVIAVLVAV